MTSSCPEVLGWPEHVCREWVGLGLLALLCPALLCGNADESLHLSEAERSVFVATQGVPGVTEAPGSQKELRPRKPCVLFLYGAVFETK